MRQVAASKQEADCGTAKKVARCRVAIHESEEGFSVWIPGLPGCVSQGDTEEDAMENIADALRDYLEVMSENTTPPGVQAREIEIAI